MNWLDFLKGKRTYIAAAALAITAVVQFQAGNLPAALESAGLALAAFGLRSALADMLLTLASQTLTQPAEQTVPQQSQQTQPPLT